MRKNAYMAIGAVAVAAVSLTFVGCGNKSATNVPDPVATVNGQSISSAQYLDQCSLQAGRQVLQNLIEQQILLQWADSEKVAPTDDQVNKQIDILKREGIYDDQVKMLGEDGLKSELRAMQARINLVEKLGKISDQEIKTTYDQMKSRFQHGPRKQIALVLNADKAKVEEAAEKIKGGMDFDKAATTYSGPGFASRGTAIKVWVEENQKGLPPVIEKAAKDTKVGEVSNVLSVSLPGQPTQYALLKVMQEQPKADIKLDQAKDEVKDTIALQKAQMDPDFQKKFTDQKKKANVDVKIDRLSDLVGVFKNPPPPSPFGNMQPGPGQ